MDEIRRLIGELAQANTLAALYVIPINKERMAVNAEILELHLIKAIRREVGKFCEGY